MSDYIPPEVLVEILLRLPAKSLLQFTCVSKLWYSLISSSNFISMYTHFNCSSTNHKNKNDPLIIRHYSRIYGKEMFTLHSDHDMCFGNYQQLDCPLRSRVGYVLDFVGSCNGLICLSDSSGSGGRLPHEVIIPKPKPIVLWNPSLGKSMVVPPMKSSTRHHYDLVLGFGFDPKSIDYKVVRLGCRNRKLCDVDVFVLSEDSWRSIGATVALPSYFFYKSPQAFFSGNIHWIGYYDQRKEVGWFRKLIVAILDVGNEGFGEFEMPGEIAHEGLPDENWQLSIVVLRNSLSLIRYDEGHFPSYNRCCIWVMNKYGVADSWIKQYSICPYNSFGKTLDLRMNGKFLLVTDNGELVLFDPKSRRVNRLGIYGETCSFHVDTFVESLAFSQGFNRVLGQASSSNATAYDKA